MQKSLFSKSRNYAAADATSRGANNNVDALESMEDGDEDISSLNEIEEHTEYDDMNPNGDDADDEMFLDRPMGESLIDDVDAYLHEEEDDEEYDDE